MSFIIESSSPQLSLEKSFSAFPSRVGVFFVDHLIETRQATIETYTKRRNQRLLLPAVVSNFAEAKRTKQMKISPEDGLVNVGLGDPVKPSQKEGSDERPIGSVTPRRPTITNVGAWSRARSSPILVRGRSQSIRKPPEAKAIPVIVGRR